jgi:hypothetical protein
MMCLGFTLGYMSSYASGLYELSQMCDFCMEKVKRNHKFKIQNQTFFLASPDIYIVSMNFGISGFQVIISLL